MDRGIVERYRLSLFGKMIMGVSHEVDNHLSVILGFAELIQIASGDEKKTREGAAKILSAGERIHSIVKPFSMHVRPHVASPELFPPSDLVKELIPFSRYDLGRGNVNVVFPDDVPSGLMTGDRRDLGLAILCLLFNGSEAMKDRPGTLRLDVSRESGGWEFRVSDEGPGIPDADIGRVFEEGFTSKKDPSHTGVGLPVADHLVAGMGGTLTIANRPSGGCLATIRLPGK